MAASSLSLTLPLKLRPAVRRSVNFYKLPEPDLTSLIMLSSQVLGQPWPWLGIETSQSDALLHLVAYESSPRPLDYNVA